MNASELVSTRRAHTTKEPDAFGDDRLSSLERYFPAGFHLVDASLGTTLHHAPGQPPIDLDPRMASIAAAARRGRMTQIDEEDPFLIVALPLDDDPGGRVAVAAFVIRPVTVEEDLIEPALRLGLAPREAAQWAARQTPWPSEALEAVGDLLLSSWSDHHRLAQLEQETQDLSVNLASTYEEISLLHRLSQNLKISRSNEELARIVLEWLLEVLPARGVAIRLPRNVEQEGVVEEGPRTVPLLLTSGDWPIAAEQFTELVAQCGAAHLQRPLVLNPPKTTAPDWPYPGVRQLVVVSLLEGENHFGHLAVANHCDGAEFGTVEGNLLGSVAAILGIHSGNLELYRQQSELLSGIVRALTSAIDAKDPYTCGHSDRVARVAVCLARELGCDAAARNDIYLAGLLHDVGKIGVDDLILRKPNKLTAEEYEHIQRHVRIGHRILMDLKKLDEILPAVLYHHEAWDGGGYPRGLAGEAIPAAARIIAVADSFDAMGSDRPYRKGLPDEKIDEIFAAGRGRQWDPAVVDAFFRCREEVRHIAREQYVSPPIDPAAYD